MKKIGRLLTAMVTPFNARGAVDYKQAKRLALALINSGSDGVVVVGTTGESPTTTHAEDARLFAEIKAVVGNKGVVIAGTGSNSTAEAIEATRAAERTGADGCLVVVPYYNKPTRKGSTSTLKLSPRAPACPASFITCLRVRSRTWRWRRWSG